MPKTTQNRSLHSPFPDIFSFRKWDFTLLDRYKPVFGKSDKVCHLCGLGPCKPMKSPQPPFAKGGKEEGLGKCGIDETGFKARAILLDAVIGASGHTSHAARLLEDLIKRFGKNCPVSAGLPTNIPTPITTLITGRKPENIGDLKDIIAYIEGQLTHLLSSISFGTEASPEDFVSKMLHAGMLDNLAMEIADIAQLSAMNMPKGESNSKLINIGLETVDTSKPVILIIGHNSFVAHEIMRLIEGRGLKDKIEVCGLCCAASDGARHSHDFKIIGNQSAQLDVIKSGIADVVILDTQCIRADVVREANKIGSLVIATTQETALGLSDLTDAPVDKVKEHILKSGAGIILDKKMAAEIALNIGVRKKSINNQIMPSAPGFLRIGRGPIRDSEIRGIAPSIVMGEIPGIIGIFGCPEERQGSGVSGRWSVKPVLINSDSAAKRLAEEFLARGYIVSTGGCASMDVAKGDLFKDNADSFDSRNLTNLGSCVSASHLIGACIKIARIMCHRKLEGNYEEIADYIINRVGAVVILWGGFTQKAFSSALGMARLGIPVIFGPRLKNYGINLMAKDNGWCVKDARFKDMVSTGPAPQSLICYAETAGDVLPLAAKLCMRPNDTSEGRKAKLKNYIGLYNKGKKRLPPDINLFVRTHYDIPEEVEQKIQHFLQTKDWHSTFIPDPTML
ncbi:MAG: hypothetical protein Q8P28_07410 [Deltaproteobacteria bacterium]|nr:hypothetical protein [Deltaproteobacteria bacterium]